MPGTSLTELSSPFSGEKRRSSTPSGSRWRNSFCQVRGVSGKVRGCSGLHLRSGAPRDMHVLTDTLLLAHLEVRAPNGLVAIEVEHVECQLQLLFVRRVRGEDRKRERKVLRRTGRGR